MATPTENAQPSPIEDPACRREEPRFGLRRGAVLPASVVCLDQQVLDVASAVDVSATGAKLKIPRYLDNGTVVEVRMVAARVDSLESIEATVCWSQPAGGNHWWIGVRFDDESSAEWIGELSEHGILDRRYDPRRKRVAQKTRVKLSCEDEYREGQLVNLSPGGFLLSFEEQPPRAEKLLLEFDKPNGGVAQVVAKVAWNREGDGAYLIGCQLTSRESYEAIYGLMKLGPPKRSEENSTSSLTAVMITAALAEAALLLIK